VKWIIIRKRNATSVFRYCFIFPLSLVRYIFYHINSTSIEQSLATVGVRTYLFTETNRLHWRTTAEIHINMHYRSKILDSFELWASRRWRDLSLCGCVQLNYIYGSGCMQKRCQSGYRGRSTRQITKHTHRTCCTLFMTNPVDALCTRIVNCTGERTAYLMRFMNIPQLQMPIMNK
jgi:hypothetical protein